MKSGAALLLLSAAAMLAQPPMEITGNVVEPGTNLGIFDATVTISRMEPREGTTDAHIEVAKLTTDAQGNFRYPVTTAATYMLTVQKPGFNTSMATAMRGTGASQVSVAVHPDTPRREVHFFLGRTGTIRGRLLDADTGEPASGLSIVIGTYVASSGSITLLPGGLARPDKAGEFSASAAPGRYIIEIRPILNSSERILKEFTAEDASATDKGYVTSYFPGSPQRASVLPIVLPSGGVIDLGNIRLRRETFFRARVKTGGSCSPEQTVSIQDVLVKGNNSSSVEAGKVPCGGEVLLRYLEPGSHILNGTVGSATDEMLTASFPVEITSGNGNATLTLARGADIAGRVVAAEGAGEIPFERVRLQMLPRPISSNDIQNISLNPDGLFQLENIRLGRKQLNVRALDERFYVKQIRFNGGPVIGATFDLAGNASVEVEIDTQSATLNGTVQDRDKPVPGADVVLLRSDDSSFPRHVTADDKGAFRVAGLAPGEYRFFAVSAAARERAEEPGAWSSLVTSAEKVVLGRGATQNLTLKLSEPR